jgi:hypothetical protein
VAVTFRRRRSLSEPSGVQISVLIWPKITTRSPA